MVNNVASEIEHKNDTTKDKQIKKINNARLVGVPPSSNAANAVEGINIAATDTAKIAIETKDKFARFWVLGRGITL